MSYRPHKNKKWRPKVPKELAASVPISRGKYRRAGILEVPFGKFQLELHPTKGWRCVRQPA